MELRTIDHSSRDEDGLFREEQVTPVSSILKGKLSLWTAAGIYLLVLLLIYWPVFLGHRFFWEDFFIQEYPIREYSYYMAALKHAIPFWNPYSWAFAPLLADAQSGFWYPTNLLQICYMMVSQPGCQHLPVIVPELATLLHLPIAALGVFQLSRRQFAIPDRIAVIAGLTFGFGVQMVADQNHSMFILQLALLPWEMLLLMRGWKSWRYAIGFGVLFGVSFLAGQPQVFLFASFFFGVFSMVQAYQVYCDSRNIRMACEPLCMAALGMLVALGITAIQLLPSLELAQASARAKLSFPDASFGGIHLGHLINFFVPKFYGEYPGFGFGHEGMFHTDFWYWEATFYWSAMGEILAVFAVVSLWRNRGLHLAQARFVRFAACFSIFAIAYGLGNNLGIQWLFWKFIPLFDQIRAPNRMIWFLWLLGSICSGIGLERLVLDRALFVRYRRFFFWSCGLFVSCNLLAITGVFDLIFNKPHVVRSGIVLEILPSFIAACCVTLFFVIAVKKSLHPVVIYCFAVILIAGDLYFNDFTWHRNTLNREATVTADSSSFVVREFRKIHGEDHSKLVLLDVDSIRRMTANLGMFLRMPIEFADDSMDLTLVNPMRLSKPFPPVRDSNRRMEMMGVSMIVTNGSYTVPLTKTIPFLKLYRQWAVTNDSAAIVLLLNDSLFDFQKKVILNENPKTAGKTTDDSVQVQLRSFGENELDIEVSSPADAVLLVNDLFYPGWQATVDGRPMKVLKAFQSLRAVAVPAGRHSVVMRYESRPFAAGWKISAGTLLLAIIVLLSGIKKSNLRNQKIQNERPRKLRRLRR